ncbi:MAG TPA: endonuclease III [Gemmatimonadales bacterium]|nr:endonuclease III [Gemmatimonadales bacterium]
MKRSESPAALKQRTRKIVGRLTREFPDAHCALDHRNAYELTAATILSAQCTDARVNLVTPVLFKAYPDPESLAAADQAAVENIIKSTGFFRNKAKSLLGMARALVERHGGRVPDTMDALVKLPGVGRKTANVVLGNAFGKNEGIVVDTHVQRISGLLRLTREKTPEKIELALMPLVPRPKWTIFSHLLILHGRKTCIARRPLCGECRISDLCPSADL